MRVPRAVLRHKPVDLSRVVSYPLARRASKVQLSDMARPLNPAGARAFLDSLPHQLKAADLGRFITAVSRARKVGKPVHAMMGAHVIKVGLSPIIIDLMRHGIVTGVSFSGAGLIHELELAFTGRTSEDVARGLADGSFGMAKETAIWFSEATQLAGERSVGLGRGFGEYIRSRKAPHARLSILAEAARLDLPATAHVAIGADIVAQSPHYNAAQIGELSHMDFRLLAAILGQADTGGAGRVGGAGRTGGVVLNIGSAVILPEVFLKALTVARNLGRGRRAVSGRIVTANFDMIMSYRPRVNVVERPTALSAGYEFIGHHEIMIPLVAWALRAACPSRKKSS